MDQPDPAPPPSSQPIRTQLLTSLTAQTALLTSLFNALASSSPATSAPVIPPAVQRYLETLPSGSSIVFNSAGAQGVSIHNGQIESGLQTIYRALEAVDAHFATLLDEVCEHQEAWDALMRKKAEAEGLERKVRETIRGLQRDKDELEECVREGKKVRESMEKAEKDPVDVPTLLAVALNLAPTSSAPVSTLIPSQHRAAHHMPWPTEAVMRAGLLFRTNGSMSGVGDLGRIGDEQDQSRRVIEPVHHHDHAHMEERRTHDPDWVMDLDLNSDSDEE